MKQVFFTFLAVLTMMAISCNQGNRQNTDQDYDQGNRMWPREGGMRSGNFDPEEVANRQIEGMKETMELSSEQENQLREIILDNYEKMSEMREEARQSGGGFEGMREQMQELRSERDEKIKAILTDEQWEQYQDYQEEMRERRRQGGPGGPR